MVRALKKCLKRKESSDPYILPKNGANVRFVDHEIKNLKISDDPIYVCTNCLSFGGSLTRPSGHSLECLKKTNSQPAKERFHKFQGYCYKTKGRMQFFCINHDKDNKAHETSPGMNISLVNDSAVDVIIGGFLIIKKKENLIIDKDSGKLLNPFTNEVYAVLKRRKELGDQIDEIYKAIETFASQIDTPNYYKADNGEHNTMIINKKLEYCKEEPLLLYVCHSCEKVAWTQRHLRRMKKHLASCQGAQHNESDIAVYEGYYKVDTVTTSGKPVRHYLAVSENFKKFTSIDTFERPKPTTLGELTKAEVIADEKKQHKEIKKKRRITSRLSSIKNKKKARGNDAGNNQTNSHDILVREASKSPGLLSSSLSEIVSTAESSLSEIVSSQESSLSEIISTWESSLPAAPHSSNSNLSKESHENLIEGVPLNNQTLEPTVPESPAKPSFFSGNFLWKSISNKFNLSSSPLEGYSEDEGYLGDDGLDEAEKHKGYYEKEGGQGDDSEDDGGRLLTQEEIAEFPDSTQKGKSATPEPVYQDFEDFESEFQQHQTSPQNIPKLTQEVSKESSSDSDAFFTPTEDRYMKEESDVPTDNQNGVVYQDDDFEFGEDEERVYADYPSSPILHDVSRAKRDGKNKSSNSLSDFSDESRSSSETRKENIHQTNGNFKLSEIKLIPIRSEPDRADEFVPKIPLIPTSSTKWTDSENESSDLSDQDVSKLKRFFLSSDR